MISAKEILAVADRSNYSKAAEQVGRKCGDPVSHLVEEFNREGLAAIQPKHGGEPVSNGDISPQNTGFYFGVDIEKEDVRLLRVLTDRGTEYCSALEHHEYEPRPKLAIRKQTEFANVFTVRSRKSFTRSRSARRSTIRSRNCKPIWTSGFYTTTKKGPTARRIVSG